MRLLLTIPCYWPAVSYGGPVEKARGLADALADHGCEVTVLTSNLLDRSRRLSRQTVHRLVGSARVVYLNSPLRYRWTPLCPEAVPWSWAHVREFDVVHVMGYRDPIGLAASWAAHRHGISLVFEPLGMYRPTFRNIVLKVAFDQAFGRRIPRWANVVIATSGLERRDLLGAGVDPEKIRIRPNGVDDREFSGLPPRGSIRPSLGIDETDRVLLYLGRVSRQKGLTHLAATLPSVPDAHLVVAGPDTGDGARQDLERAASALGVRDRVHLIGVLDRKRRRQALADADALALPSTGESFGNAAAEGVAAGLPVLVTDRCGVAEFIGAAALQVPYEAEAISDGVRRLLQDTKLKAAMAAAAPAVSQRLRWTNVAGEQAAIYRSLTSPDRAS